MPRKPRIIRGNIAYHLLNRAAARAKIFHSSADYAAFERTLEQAHDRYPLRILAYVLMPNHFHLVLWPNRDQAELLSHFMRWLQLTHTQRWHARHHTSGTGPLYQGRFKAFPIQTRRPGDSWSDSSFALRRVCRYVERNPLRAKLVKHAQDWPWSSLHRRLHGTPDQQKLLAPWPEDSYPGNTRWLQLVNTPQRPAEEAAIQLSIQRNRPLGTPEWTRKIAADLQLSHTLNPRGRPKRDRNQ
jgi:putative transposase